MINEVHVKLHYKGLERRIKRLHIIPFFVDAYLQKIPCDSKEADTWVMNIIKATQQHYSRALQGLAPILVVVFLCETPRFRLLMSAVQMYSWFNLKREKLLGKADVFYSKTKREGCNRFFFCNNSQEYQWHAQEENCLMHLLPLKANL